MHVVSSYARHYRAIEAGHMTSPTPRRPRPPSRTHLADRAAPTSQTQPHTLRRGGPIHPADTAPEATTGDDRLTMRSEEHTSELQSRFDLVCRLLLEKQ